VRPPEIREETPMRKILIALAFVIAIVATPALNASLAPTTAYAATLTTGGAIDTGTNVLNSQHKHKKAAKKGLKHNLSNSRHRT